MTSDTQTGEIGGEQFADDAEHDFGGKSAGAGATLRAARESKRLELSHIAAETRIPIHHLEVIEAGDFEALPSRAYAIGFTRTYARVVGLDEEAIADAVRSELSDQGERHHHGAGAMEPGDPAKLPSSALTWFGAIAAILLVIGVIAFSSSYFGQGADLPSLSRDDGAPASEETETELAAAEAPGSEAQVSPADPSGDVVFTALEDGVWVRFYERGGERLYEAQMESGESFTLPEGAREPLINTGRPDAFAITIGGREVPPLAEGPRTMGGEPVSASALLARGEASGPSTN